MAELNGPTATNRAAATQVNGALRSITGIWQESSVVSVTVIETQGRFEARSSYAKAGFGEIRWIMHGTVTYEGRIDGELRHTKAPADWQIFQIREGQLSADGNTISGRARWEWDEGDWHTFTWTRRHDGNANMQLAFPPSDPTPHLRDDAPDSLKALAANTDAHRSELVSQAEKEYEDAIVDLAIRRKGQIDPIRNTQRVGGAGKNGDTFDIRAKDVRWLFPSQDAKDRSIEECEHLIDQLKQNAEDMKTTLVVLPTNEFSYLKPGAKMNWIGVFQGSVEQVIDDDNLIVKPFMDGQPDIWIEGVHTAGLIDNEIIGGPNAQAPGIPIWVNGTKRYDTAIGSTRTILKAGVFELSKFLQK